MQTSNTNRGLRSKDLTWYLLGEYPLSNILSGAEIDDRITAPILSQMGGTIENQNESIERNTIKLSSLAKEAMEKYTLGRVEAPGRIRIYCQKKMIEEGVNGGWGYFVIERSSDTETNTGIKPGPYVDLYIYKECI